MSNQQICPSLGRKDLSWILVMEIYQDIETVGGKIRRFDSRIDPIHLMWHRDEFTRIVETVEPTDWQIQLEDQLPQVLDKIEIPSGVWHRLIKGSGDLVIKIKEINNLR